MSPFKPMLAATHEDLDKVTFPVIAQPKHDGVRVLIVDGVAVYRTLDPIPNDYIRAALSRPELNGLDGELITYGHYADQHDCATISGNLNRKDGEVTFEFAVFDDFTDPELPYETRLANARKRVWAEHGLFAVRGTVINNADVLEQYEGEWTDVGMEGIVYRDPLAPYKFGRSTLKEGGLVKWVRRKRDEAVITGFYEQMENQNEAEKDNFGRTKRSTSKAGKVGKGVLGGLHATWNGVPIKVATGINAAMRESLWADREKLIGGKLTFEYRELLPTGKPRFPVFIGLRFDI